MIDMTTWVWFSAGLVAGLMHAATLWRAAKRLTVWTPVWGMLRIAVVTTTLVLSAISGMIFASAAGWAIGIAVLGTWFAISGGNQSVAPANARSHE